MAYNHNRKKGTKKIGVKIVLIKRTIPNNPDIKNIVKEILAAFFSPNEDAYVLTPNLRSPSASCIPSGRS